MNYLRQNAERLVIKWMITKKPELIREMNLKEWFWNREGKALGWALLASVKENPNQKDHSEFIYDYLNPRTYDQSIEPEHLDTYLSIELPDDITMWEVFRYHKFMGMMFEMYNKRDGFSEKEIAAMQAIAELVKRGKVNQKCEDIVLKLYEKHIGLQFYNTKHKQRLNAEMLRQKEEKMLNKIKNNE